uniref:Tubulin-tyrosine ligase family protein n=1 Tax=Panagrolaimus sp. PS1159 TaxID=55785 RepID=A0AC35GR89_9BILA
MGCSQSTNQVVPCNIYDDSIEKHFSSTFSSSKIFGSSIESKSTASEASISSKTGFIGKSLTEDKNKFHKKNENFNANKFQRQSSLDSNFSENGSLPGSYSYDYSKMLNLEEYSIDTSRAKSNLNVVTLCAKKLGIKDFPEGRHDGKPANIYWHSVVFNDMKSIVKSPESKINKFPGMTELAKKISLTQSILSMQQLFPNEYGFYPKSWVLPAQLNDFHNYCSTTKQSSWFIVKPDDGAQGTGIYLIQNNNQLQDTNSKQLIQEYIDDPFLMSDQLKFDFRVYAVIKSINPLSIYIAREGMARFCTEKYSKPTSSNFENLYSHLTNYSLNKENTSYIHSTNLKDQLKGSKRLLSTVFHQMESHGVRTRRLWHGIKMIVVKTVLAMVPEIMLNYEHYFNDVPGPQCFQIMGFDIIVKKDGTPILLEVNSAPSLSIDHNVFTEEVSPPVRSIVDEMIKVPLVRDTILLVLNQLENQYTHVNVA